MKNRNIRQFLNNAPVVKTLHYKALFAYHRHYTRVVKRDESKKEIKLIGLRRSGNHALINWILNQHFGLVNFCNDLLPGQPPEEALTKETRFNHKRTDVFENPSYPEQKCLVYSYEDQPLEQVFGEEATANRNAQVGGSAIAFEGLIVRDPFNQLASWMVWDGNAGQKFRGNAEYRKFIIERWKSYAREALGETQFLKRNKTVLNYNHWVTNPEYRQQLAHDLLLHFTDEGVSEGNYYGKGSSFSPGDGSGKDRQKGVLERWQKLRDNETYQSIFQDGELIAISNKLFGEIPGTTDWLQSFNFKG